MVGKISRALCLDLYEKLVLARTSELKAIEAKKSGKILSPLLTSLGQEAVGVGACASLKEDDFVQPSHRGGTVNIVRGGDDQLKAIWAEYLGKETGCCMGRGCAFHLGNFDKKILHSTGVIGSALPHAVGVGLSIRLRESDQVCMIFFGDGATNEGTFHESLNLASIWNLPVIFVCENNQYAISMPVKRSVKVKKISERSLAYAIPGITVDGNDVLAVYKAARTAVERARKKKGPTLIECSTYSITGHSVGDPRIYAPAGELEKWKKKDPVEKYRKYLQDSGMLDELKMKEIDEQCVRRVEQAMKFAEESPEVKPEDATKFVFVTDEV